MSGLSRRMRSICSWGLRASFMLIASMQIAPAPNAARSALSAVMLRTTPATMIWSPPPALEVER